MIELEPVGRRRGAAPAAAGVSAKHATVLMLALLAAVLVGGALSGQPRVEPPRHLVFDEPAPSAVDRSTGIGAGESALSVGATEPVRPPDRIPAGWSWRPVGPLSGRQGNIAVWTGTEVVYWGGDRPGRPPEGAAYDPKADRWRRLSRSPLANRSGAAAVWTGREVLVFGGVNGQGPQRDGAAYDPATDRWRTIADGGLSGRVPLAAAWTGREMLVVGVRGPGLFHGVKDAAAYDPATDSWRTLPSMPVQINDGASAWTGSELVVFGTFLDRQRGMMAPDRRAHGAALDPLTATWRELPVAPLSGQGLALAWTGSALFGWDHDRKAAAYEVEGDAWRPIPDVPLAGRDCLPRGVAAGSAAWATHCGQAAMYRPERRAWQVVATPATAVDPPVWTGDGLVQWLGPSGRPADGTWFRPVAP